jgi:hypothetical protein
MKRHMVIVVSLTILAATIAFGRNRAAPTGMSQAAAASAPVILTDHPSGGPWYGHGGYYGHPYGYHHHGYYPYRHHYHHRGWRYYPSYPYRYYNPYRYHPYGYYFPYNYYYDRGNTWDFYPYYYFSW